MRSSSPRSSSVLPAVPGLVHRTDEADLAAIAALDDPGLAVHEAADAIGRDPDHRPAPGEKRIQPLIALAVEQRLRLDRALVPTPEHPRLADPRHLQVLGRQIHIADDANVWDALQSLVGDLEQRAGEIAGDAPIAARALQLLGEEAPVEAGGARREAPNRHLSCPGPRADQESAGAWPVRCKTFHGNSSRPGSPGSGTKPKWR